jgi:hypothetical protein
MPPRSDRTHRPESRRHAAPEGNAGPMKYGRGDDEWNELMDAATEYLVEVAKDRTVTSYTDLSSEHVRRTGYSGFDFNTDRDQAAVGALLGAVTDGTYAEIGAMLSSLVVLKATGDSG